MRRAFKYRLYPSANQLRDLETMLETHRRLYNQCLEQRKTAYEILKKTVGHTEQCKWFTTAKKSNPFYAKINAQSAQTTLKRLDKAFAAFFRRVKSGKKPGYPRFKSREQFNTVEFPQYPSGAKLTDNRFYVQHVGLLRVNVHRPHTGTVKTASLTCEGDKWYVILSCDLGDIEVEPNGLPAVGVDVGLEHFLTTSDSTHVANPRLLKAELPKLRRLQRSMCRKKKGGSNRRKARKRVAALHARVNNLRKEFHHQTSCSLVHRYGLIAVEKLNIRGMIQNRRLARSIADVAWGNFLLILRHKAESAGAVVVEVDCRGTSQECSRCGVVVRKDLSVRTHDCPSCGLVLQRDHNAALNILARARPARTEPVGLNSDGGVSQETARL